jgi:Zn ribbon nucleic-acid-binding protein
MCLNTDDTNLVDPEDRCPVCSERRADMLVWREDGTVECAMCGTVYRPGDAPA